MSDLPTPEQIRKAAAAGHPISVLDVSDIAQAEGGQPQPGGPSATAHSVYSRQCNLENKAAEILSKPSAAITKEDAAELQSAEARALGRQPGRDSLSAEIQSLADENENKTHIAEELGMSYDVVDTEPPAPAAPYITKDDAAQMQSIEASLYGRQVRGGLASQMQSSADKLESARGRKSS
ncbi:hypothetical protein VTO42DRAFT_2872 [Malbranchea cinnamomea]